MSTFCLIAFIPCIILVVLLFVELRKFIVVNKKFKIVKRSWERLQKRKSATRERDGFVESIPPPPPDYHDSHPAPSPVFIDYDERDISYSRTRQRRAKPLRTRRRADPEYDSSYYDDHARDHLYDEESGYRDELEPEYDREPSHPKGRTHRRGRKRSRKDKRHTRKRRPKQRESYDDEMYEEDISTTEDSEEVDDDDDVDWN